ncbi:spore germination protein GerW family protein [Streptomyces sp. O3]
MTAEDDDSRTPSAPPTGPPTDLPPADAAIPLLECLADRIGGRASVTAVYGEPVTSDGVTVIPVAEFAFGFGGGTDSATRIDEKGSGRNGGGGGGGAAARPRGFIEIKDGTATYKPLRTRWSDVVPLAALLAGAAIPSLTRRLARRRAH